MKSRALLGIVVLLVVAANGPAAGADYPEGNARVTLVSSTHQMEQGVPVLVGVLFDIKPGWHIYWRNPGGAGLATNIRWRLPTDLDIGDLQWPLPVAFTQSGDIPGYGYEGSVVLAAALRFGSSQAGDMMVGASVSWLACKDVCVLGSAELDQRWAEIAVDRRFEDWTATQPQTRDRTDLPFSLTSRGSLAGGKLELWLRWQTPPGSVEWFPDSPQGLEVKDVKIQTRGGLTRIDVVVRPLDGSAGTPDTLDSVVVVTDANKQRRGWNLAVDLFRKR